MKNALKAAAGIAALSFALGACASAPTPSPRLLAAEASLQQAKATPATFESGRAPLEKAEIALRDAREFYMKRDDEKYIHAMRMGEGYVALAKSRGDQVVANRKITSLNKDRADVVAQARTRQVNTAEAATAVANAATAQAEARASQSEIVAANAIAAKASADTARMAAEARTAALRAELAGYEQKNTALGVTLIQIAGHTDSQGADAANMTLSANRSASVGAYLVSTGVNASRISSIGMGESAPVATNDTAAGRAINRRVEVTILN